MEISDVQADIARRQAIADLLSLPDAPDLHRGYRQTLEGLPDRYNWVPRLAAAYIQAKLLDMRERGIGTVESPAA
jgi:hypothetical protein